MLSRRLSIRKKLRGWRNSKNDELNKTKSSGRIIENSLFKRPFLALIVIGILILIIAATGAIPVGKGSPPLQINSVYWRVFFATLGLILLSIGLYKVTRGPSETTKAPEEPLRPSVPIVKPKNLPALGVQALLSETIALIKIISGPLTNSWVLITKDTGRIIFGRGPESDINFQKPDDIDEFVSIKHFSLNVGIIQDAKTRKEAYKIKITELDSINGTFLNSQRLPSNKAFDLTSGDEIWIGGSILIFKWI
jgi:hypothetical protein